MNDAFGVRHRPAAFRCESWPRRLDRKVIQGTRSEKGLENHGVLRSLLETAKRQGKKAQSCLLELFTKGPALAQGALYRNPLLKPNRRAVFALLKDSRGKALPGIGAKLLRRGLQPTVPVAEHCGASRSDA